MKKALIPLIILILLIGGIVLVSSSKPAANGQTNPSQTDFKNNVEIEVVWNNLVREQKDWIFDLIFTTHSGDLTTLPIGEMAKLEVGGERITGLNWEITSPDPHHMKGTLKLSNPPKVDINQQVTLILKGVGGSEEHRFTWGTK
ncbi:hypothetical protein L1765_12205 [Microaerobacter geothermalis]|uniref:hypothetical protein n=1 Tax=Microaerobacter geothermalis TaxID=674972 RepID=UPI001F3A8118|nr:hypothetical protein [Microaerobacter geothermalis]MCF6094724.1 hypothetical protein [Microaerobacter geothermalis]